MSIDLPLGRLNWAGVSDEKSNGRVKCDPTLGRSAFPDQNPTLYLPLGFRKSEMIQRMAGSPAPGQDRLRMQKASASKADVIAAIRLEALIQTAYHVLNSPEEILSLPSKSDLLPRYFSWLRQYCDTHYVHFLHDHAWSNPLAGLDSSCTYPTRLADQQQLGRRSKEVGDFSRRYLYLPFTNNDDNVDNVKLGKPAKLPAKSGATGQRKTSCTEERTFEVFSECSSRQENKASPVYNAVCSPIRIFNDMLCLSEVIQSLDTKQRSVNTLRGLAESEGLTAVSIILPHLRTAATDSEQDGEVETQRTDTISTQGQIDHGRSVQKHQRNSTWPSVVGKKRSTNAEDSSDDDDDEKRPRKSIAQNENSPKFACPYYKRDPHRFSSERTCSGPGWPNIQRLKEHLFRRHKAPDHQCPRCLLEFEDNQSKMQHCQAQETCKVGQSPSTTGFLDENKMRLLKQRGKTTASESEKWLSVYQILFPNETSLPSPYYENKGKSPELPPKTVAHEMFRKNLDGALSEWESIKCTNPQILKLIKNGAVAAFDETLSALYRQRMSPDLDDKIPPIAVSVPERDHNDDWLRPYVTDSDATGKTSFQAHRAMESQRNEISKPAFQQCSAVNFNTGTWEDGTIEAAGSQIPDKKALTAPVSQLAGQTMETSFWHLQPQASSVEILSQSLQQQAHQQDRGQVLSKHEHRKVPLPTFKCSLCEYRTERNYNLRRHDQLHHGIGPKKRPHPKSALTSYQGRRHGGVDIGPPTPIDTPREENGMVVFDHHLPDDGIVHNDQLFEVLDNDFIGDIPKTENKGKGVERRGRVLDTDTSNHVIPDEVYIYEPPAVLNSWHSGFGGIWSPNHQDGISHTIAEDHGLEDSVSSHYLREDYNYGT